MEITDKYKVKAFILAGGEAARARICEHKPRACVAVACERDLVAGISDVASAKLIGIGIPNKRPEGPCKNTTLDLKEFENAVRFFLGKPQLS